MIVYILSLIHPFMRFPLSQAHVMISGAGPVGLVAALVLARAGVQVTVAESAPP